MYNIECEATSVQLPREKSRYSKASEDSFNRWCKEFIKGLRKERKADNQDSRCIADTVTDWYVRLFPYSLS